MDNREQIAILFDAVDQVEKTYAKWSKSKGLSYNDVKLYYALMEYGEPITQKQLCEDLDVAKTTLNSIVKCQIKLGYIELLAHPNSKKEKLVVLTKKGKEFAEKLILPLFEKEEAAISSLSIEDIQAVSKILNTYVDKLTKNLFE